MVFGSHLLLEFLDLDLESVFAQVSLLKRNDVLLKLLDFLVFLLSQRVISFYLLFQLALREC